MKIETYACDKCNKLMREPDEGFIFLGNVLALSGGGYIGNNIDADSGKVIRELHYCKECTKEILMLG